MTHLPPIKNYIGQPCPYCGHKMTREGKRRVTRDHKIPRALGAKLTPDNRLIVCDDCNGDKKHYTLGEWHGRLYVGGDRRARFVWTLIATDDGSVNFS